MIYRIGLADEDSGWDNGGLRQMAWTAVAIAITEVTVQAQDRLGETMREIENWPSARLHESSISWPSSGSLKITAEPYSVHLFVFPK